MFPCLISLNVDLRPRLVPRHGSNEVFNKIQQENWRDQQHRDNVVREDSKRQEVESREKEKQKNEVGFNYFEDPIAKYVNGRRRMEEFAEVESEKRMASSSDFCGDYTTLRKTRSKSQPSATPSKEPYVPVDHFYSFDPPRDGPTEDLGRVWDNKHPIFSPIPKMCDDGKLRLNSTKLTNHPRVNMEQFDFYKPQEERIVSRRLEPNEILEQKLTPQRTAAQRNENRRVSHIGFTRHEMQKTAARCERPPRVVDETKDRATSRQQKHQQTGIPKAHKIQIIIPFKKAANVVYEEVLAVVHKVTAIPHQFIKHFQTERVIQPDEEFQYVTVRQNRKMYVIITATFQESDVPQESTNKSESSNNCGSDSQQTEECREKYDGTTRSTETSYDNNQSHVSSADESSNKEKVPQASQSGNSSIHNSNENSELIGTGNVTNFNDGTWLDTDNLDGYMQVLRTKYIDNAWDNNIDHIKNVVVYQHPRTRNWEFNNELFNVSHDADDTKLFGYLASGEHFVSYLIMPMQNKIVIYGVDNLPSYTNDMKSGAKALQTGIQQVYGKDFNLEYRDSVLPQKDGYNCGISVLLEYETLLAGVPPEGIKTLDDYRRVVRQNIRTSSEGRQSSKNQESRSKIQQRKQKLTPRVTLPEYQVMFVNAEDLTPTNDTFSTKKVRIDSLTKFCESHGELFEQKDGGILCKACTNYGKTKTDKIIKYDYKHGTDFSHMKRIPKVFENFKQRVKEHVETVSHMNSAFQMDPIKYPLTQPPEKQAAALALGRETYNTLYEGNSYKSLPRSNSVNAENKLKIGELNHSWNFAPAMAPHFAKCLFQRVRSMCAENLPNTQRPPHFAVVADKCTPNKQTLHLIGLVIPDEEVLKPIFLRADPIKGGKADDLARSIRDVLLDFFTVEEIKQQCVGFAFDGQYFHLGVPGKLKTLLEIPPEDWDYYSFINDPSHLLELGGRDARKQKSGDGLKIGVKWIAGQVRLITQVGQMCKMGKNWTYLNNKYASGKLDGVDFRLLSFESWCHTRFSAHVFKVFDHFRNNYPAVYDLLKELKHRYLDAISKVTFPLRLCALADIYQKIRLHSRRVQNVQLAPWQVDQELQELIDTLKNMRNELEFIYYHSEPHTALAGSIYWTKLAECLSEIIGPKMYRNRPLTGTDKSLDSFQSVAMEAIEHVEAFYKSLEDRICKASVRVNQIIRDCFSFASIQARAPSKLPPPSFNELYVLGRNVGCVSRFLSYTSMTNQYMNFVDVVEEHMQSLGIPVFKTTPYEEFNFYTGLLFKAEYKEKVKTLFPDLVNILAASVTRTSCESVTESMGSVVKDILHGRESLSVAHLNDEMCIRWNGLTPVEDDVNNLLSDAFDSRFNGPGWHTSRTSHPRKLKKHKISKSVDAEKRKKGRFSYPKKLINDIWNRAQH